MVSKNFKPIGLSELRNRAEQLLRKERKTPPEKGFDDPHFLLDELMIHQAELEISNEELRRANHELSDIYEEYVELYFDHAPCGYVIINPNGFVSRINQTAIDLLGTKIAFLKHNPFLLLLHPSCKHEYLLSMKKAMDDRQKQVVEFRLSKEDEDDFWLRADIQSDFGDADEFLRWRLTLVDITDRVKAAKELRESELMLRDSLRERETLLRELYHRTKNNMQTIMSLIQLQCYGIEDEFALRLLKETKNRIHAMALVHEKLYGTESLTSIDLKEYFRDLVDLISREYQHNLDIFLRFRADKVLADIDTAIPCGLIVNELITNAFKHAFTDGRKGRIEVCLKSDPDGSLNIAVEDNGVGLPEGFDIEKVKTLGLLSVFQLTRYQLKGTLKISSGSGTQFHIRFKPRAGNKNQGGRQANE